MKVTQSCLTLCNPMDYTSPWNSLGQNTGVGSHSLLQGIFPTQGSNPGLLHCRQILFFLIFIFTLFCFTILYWFCHTLTWISHGCTWVPNPEPPSHLPPYIISLDHPHVPAPSILYPVSNIDWWFVSYMIVYMFQCHSPKSSHPLPLPQSPKVRSTHLCLFCCLSYRVIITIFLNSIYMC